MQTGFTNVFLLLLATLLSLSACSTSSKRSEVEQDNPLRVGVTADYPPFIFKHQDKVAGIEADFARRLASELGRPVRFIELPWENQIAELQAGRTDIIMSGMTITEARQERIRFAQPYLRLGMAALVRAETYRRFRESGVRIPRFLKVGAQKGSIGERYARLNFQRAIYIPLLNATTAPFELERRIIDAFITDTPVAIWLDAEHADKDLFVIRLDDTDDYIAWGMRKDDLDTATAVEDILARWKQDGTLERVLDAWLVNG